ncbi:sensor domain-containing protein [Rhodococcus kronopolitis]|uniref:Sensor domain-containing protein n=1 Tax=Rhodococcus kronopolitis TaxID=1460226 RepID=A0ABV9FJF4_9NOCA
MGHPVTRSAGVLALTATAALLAGCASSDEPTGAPLPPLPTAVTAPANPGATPITDQHRLQSALLTTAQLPAGFVALPDPVRDLGLPPAADDQPTADRSSTDPQVCASVLREVADQSPGAATRAAARFGGPDFASIDTDAASFAGDGAARAFETVQQTLAACGQYRGTDADGVAVTYRLGGLDQPAVGDASIAVRLQTTSDGLTMTSDAVYAVVGSTVVQVVASGQEPIEPAVLTGLAADAVDRLRGGA